MLPRLRPQREARPSIEGTLRALLFPRMVSRQRGHCSLTPAPNLPPSPSPRLFTGHNLVLRCSSKGATAMTKSASRVRASRSSEACGLPPLRGRQRLTWLYLLSTGVHRRASPDDGFSPPKPRRATRWTASEVCRSTSINFEQTSSSRARWTSATSRGSAAS